MTDQQKLAALRRRYADAKSTDIHDPTFAKVAALLYTDPDRRKLPYAGVPTFLGLPYRGECDGQPDLDGLDIALIGVPIDLGVTNRSGARLGPRAVRNVERIGPYEHVLRCVPAAEASVADIGDVPFRSRYSLESCMEDIERFHTAMAAAGVRPLSVGGDHSMTYPILRALGRERPLGLVHIDAHCDTGGPFDGTRFHHGGPFRQAVLDGVIDPERTIQIGIRGPAEFLYEFSYEAGMTVIHADEMDAIGIPGIIERTRAVIGDGPAYLSFDIDSLDPAFAPGTGTPEVGGLTPREALAILRGIVGLDIVAGDVVEVAPQYDTSTVTAQAGAQMLFEILCLMVRAPGFKRRG